MDNPRIEVFWNGYTKLLWFYDVSKIVLIKTDKDIGRGCWKHFSKDDLVLSLDGKIRGITHNGVSLRQYPRELILQTVKEGQKCCGECTRAKPISKFENVNAVRDKTLTVLCSRCRRLASSKQNNPGTIKGERKLYCKKRRCEVIREVGCQCPGGCDLNQLRHQWSNEYLLATFEFNHLDPRKKLKNVSAPTWYTDSKAKDHGFKNWKELWEAEVGKCEVLCAGHHNMHSKESKGKRRRILYEQ